MSNNEKNINCEIELDSIKPRDKDTYLRNKSIIEKKIEQSKDKVKTSEFYYYLGSISFNYFNSIIGGGGNNNIRSTVESKELLIYTLHCFLTSLDSINSSEIYDKNLDIIGTLHTYIGNTLSYMGRTYEAIDYYYKSLTIVPINPNARGNLGIVLSHLFEAYSNQMYYPLLKTSQIYLEQSLDEDPKSKEKSVEYELDLFRKNLMRVNKMLENIKDSKIFIINNYYSTTLYEQWCYDNRLYLNPLNETYNYYGDTKLLNSVITDISSYETPKEFDIYNVIIGMYINARKKIFYALDKKYTDMSGSIYADTLRYGLFHDSIFDLFSAYTMLYSIFDKIAYFLFFHFNLSYNKANIDEKKVDFKLLKINKINELYVNNTKKINFEHYFRNNIYMNALTRHWDIINFRPFLK